MSLTDRQNPASNNITDPRATVNYPTTFTLSFPLYNDHPSNDPSRDCTSHNSGSIVIATILDFSWFRKDGEWRKTTATQSFFNADTIDAHFDRSWGYVIGIVGDMVFRHPRAEKFLATVQERGGSMIVERFLNYVERIKESNRRAVAQKPAKTGSAGINNAKTLPPSTTDEFAVDVDTPERTLNDISSSSPSPPDTLPQIDSSFESLAVTLLPDEPIPLTVNSSPIVEPLVGDCHLNHAPSSPSIVVNLHDLAQILSTSSPRHSKSSAINKWMCIYQDDTAHLYYEEAQLVCVQLRKMVLEIRGAQLKPCLWGCRENGEPKLLSSSEYYPISSCVLLFWPTLIDE
jgi:hypothetical protein